MSVLGDRVLMTIIVVTGVAGLVGYWFTIGVTNVSDRFTQWELLAVAGVGLVVLVAVVWTALTRMD